MNITDFNSLFEPVSSEAALSPAALNGRELQDRLSPPSWQRKRGGPSPKESMAHLQTLFKYGIIRKI